MYAGSAGRASVVPSGLPRQELGELRLKHEEFAAQTSRSRAPVSARRSSLPRRSNAQQVQCADCLLRWDLNRGYQARFSNITANAMCWIRSAWCKGTQDAPVRYGAPGSASMAVSARPDPAYDVPLRPAFQRQCRADRTGSTKPGRN